MLKVTQNSMPWGAVVRVREARAPEPKLGDRWRLHVINAESRFEAAGILDVNRDGKPDIFCGGFWYEAPNWTKHLVREVTEQGGTTTTLPTCRWTWTGTAGPTLPM